MNKTWIASTIAAIGLAWLGASWHAGKKIEQSLQAASQNINHYLQENILLKPSFVITQYDRGLFSSQVLLTFKLPERCGPSKEIVLKENISHGPFPWALVKQGKFKPALANSQAVLVKNDYTRP